MLPQFCWASAGLCDRMPGLFAPSPGMSAPMNSRGEERPGTFLADYEAVAFGFEDMVQIKALGLRCHELGVRLAWNTRVQVAEKQPLLLDGEPCVYRYLIGADGQSSRVRQAFGLGQGRIFSRRFGSRRHYHVKPWSRVVEVHWGDLGQAYITPVGPEEVCVATVARDPSIRLEQVLGCLPALRLNLEGASELSRRATRKMSVRRPDHWSPRRSPNRSKRRKRRRNIGASLFPKTYLAASWKGMSPGSMRCRTRHKVTR